jgi:hypothetical protein
MEGPVPVVAPCTGARFARVYCGAEVVKAGLDQDLCRNMRESFDRSHRVRPRLSSAWLEIKRPLQILGTEPRF